MVAVFVPLHQGFIPDHFDFRIEALCPRIVSKTNVGIANVCGICLTEHPRR